MIRCRWCGQESAHPQVCEWCRRNRETGALMRTLPPYPAPTPTTIAPSANTPSGDAPPLAVPTPPPALLSSEPTQAIPTPQQVASPPTGQAAAQPPADSIRFISEVIEGYTLTAKLERFFGVALPLAAINVLVLGWKPEWSVWSNLLSFFLIGVWLPASHL